MEHILCCGHDLSSPANPLPAAGFAFVVFDNAEVAAKAIGMDGRSSSGGILSVSIASNRGYEAAIRKREHATHVCRLGIESSGGRGGGMKQTAEETTPPDKKASKKGKSPKASGGGIPMDDPSVLKALQLARSNSQPAAVVPPASSAAAPADEKMASELEAVRHPELKLNIPP